MQVPAYDAMVVGAANHRHRLEAVKLIAPVLAFGPGEKLLASHRASESYGHIVHPAIK
jgi:hypothetical protein